jgi:hypothetical protein
VRTQVRNLQSLALNVQFQDLRAMHLYQAEVGDEALDSLFQTALYRFLEVHASRSLNEAVAMHTEIIGATRRKVVRLWSADAVERFDRHWREFQRERATCAPF